MPKKTDIIPAQPKADILLSQQTDNLLQDAIGIIESAQHTAYQAVNEVLIKRNWLLGLRINHEVLQCQRADYGEQIIIQLAKQLTQRYGSGYQKTNLYHFVSFSKSFPDIFHPASGQTVDENIFHALSGKSEELLSSLTPTTPIRLSWTHYRTLLQETDPKARQWYLSEAANEMWSTRTLQRNISSQYYQRMLSSQHKELVEAEMRQLTSPLQNKLEFIKNPVIAEFLGIAPDTSYLESDLENAIISNLQRFLMELGKGYAFVARQQHIHTEKEDYYIDLVFYNYILKCFVLIDLKTSKVTHQDIGQMDMYRRMYDELKRTQGDNPTLGIILCADTDEDIARYSILHGNEQLFATKYKLMLPSEEQLRAEIQAQKDLYLLQHEDTPE